MIFFNRYPKNRKKPTREEESRLRAMSPAVSEYLDFALENKGRQRHPFLRRLFALSRQTTPDLFVRTIERALRYRVDGIDTLRSIARLYLGESDPVLPEADVDEGFRERRGYIAGRLTEEPDFSPYDQMLDEPRRDEENKQNNEEEKEKRDD